MALSRDEKVILAVVAVVGVTAAGLLIYSRRARAASLPSGQRQTTPPPTLPPVVPAHSNPPAPATSRFSEDQIRRFKRILKGLGYETAVQGFVVNGTIDAPMREAIRMFQGAYNTERAARHTDWLPESLTVDGVLGPKTAQALEHYTNFLAPE